MLIPITFSFENTNMKIHFNIDILTTNFLNFTLKTFQNV